MNPVHPARFVRRLLAPAVAIASVAAGLVVISPGAQGATGQVPYECTSTEPPTNVTLTMVADTAAPWIPGRMIIGQSVPATVSSALPGALADYASDLGADQFAGVVNYGFTEGSSTSTMRLDIPTTDLGDQTTPTDVPFTATGSYLAIASGDQTLRTSDSTVDLLLHRPDGTSTQVSLSCRHPGSAGLTIDVIRVAARSTTTLSLSEATATYGETVTATAEVALDDRSTDGQVYVVVDGVARAEWVLREPLVTMGIAGLAVGAHQVGASYVSRDPRYTVNSSAATQTLVVVAAATRPRVSVTGKRTTRPTRVAVRVISPFGTTPTGRVRLVLRKLGTTQRWVKALTLDTGRDVAGFGRLDRGRYGLVLTYRGDANHVRSRAIRTFRVRRA